MTLPPDIAALRAEIERDAAGALTDLHASADHYIKRPLQNGMPRMLAVMRKLQTYYPQVADEMAPLTWFVLVEQFASAVKLNDDQRSALMQMGLDFSIAASMWEDYIAAANHIDEAIEEMDEEAPARNAPAFPAMAAMVDINGNEARAELVEAPADSLERFSGVLNGEVTPLVAVDGAIAFPLMGKWFGIKLQHVEAWVQDCRITVKSIGFSVSKAVMLDMMEGADVHAKP